MTKIVCDICGKEIAGNIDRWSVHISKWDRDAFTATPEVWKDICTECFEKIYNKAMEGKKNK